MMASISCSWAVSKNPDFTFLYVDPFDRSNTMRLDLEEKEIVTGDLVQEVEFCPHGSDYHCFKSGVLSFAVPRSGFDALASWEVNGVHYKNKGKSRLQFAATETEVFNILSVQEGNLLHFLYSTQSGLIAFGAFDESDKKGRSYFLQQAKGFAAMSPTRDPKN